MAKNTKKSQPRPQPTPELINEVREYASELHYAFEMRPKQNPHLRLRWDRQFRHITNQLIRCLERGRFSFLPRVAMGAIWANNKNILLQEGRSVVTPFETETVIPVYGTHECLAPPAHLRRAALGGITPDNYAPGLQLLPLEEVRTKWWEPYIDQPVLAAPNPPPEPGRASPEEHPEEPDVGTTRRGRSQTAVGSTGRGRSQPGFTSARRGRSQTRRGQSAQRPGRHSARPGTSTAADAQSVASDGEEEIDDVEEEHPQVPRKSARAKRATSRVREQPRRKATTASQAPATSSGVKGKRKAEEAQVDHAQGPEAKRKRAAGDMEEHKVPWKCFALAMRVSRATTPCHFCGLVSTSCRRCILKKSACSLTVAGGNAAAAYVGYEYYYRCCADIGKKNIKHAKVVPQGFQPPEWFVAQYRAISSDKRKKGPPSGNVGAVPFVPLPEISPPPSPVDMRPDGTVADIVEENAPLALEAFLRKPKKTSNEDPGEDSPTDAMEAVDEQPKKAPKNKTKGVQQDADRQTAPELKIDKRKRKGPPGLRTLPDMVPTTSVAAFQPVTAAGGPSRSEQTRAPSGVPSGSRRGRAVVPVLPLLPPRRRPSTTTAVRSVSASGHRTRSRSRAPSDSPARSRSASAAPSPSRPSSAAASPPPTTPAASSAHQEDHDMDHLDSPHSGDDDDDDDDADDDDDDPQAIKQELLEQARFEGTLPDELEYASDAPEYTEQEHILFVADDVMDAENNNLPGPSSLHQNTPRGRRSPSSSVDGSSPPTEVKGKGKAATLPPRSHRSLGWNYDRPRHRRQSESVESVRAVQAKDDYDEVPRLNGPWTGLPWLTTRTDEEPPFFPEDRPASLEDFLNLRGLVDPTGPLEGPESPDAPQTPLAQIFQLGTRTQDVLQAANEQFMQLRHLATHGYGNIKELNQLEANIQTRRRNAVLATSSIVSFQDGMEKLFVQVSAIERSLLDVVNYLATTINQVCTIADVFRFVPTAPVDWMALNELLEVYHRQESLYHEMWQRYAVVKDQIKPLSDDIAVLREQVSDVVDGATGGPSSIDKKTVDRLFVTLEEHVASVRKTCELDTMAQLKEVWKELNRIAGPAQSQSQSIIQSIQEMKEGYDAVRNAQQSLQELLDTLGVRGTLTSGMAELQKRVDKLELHVGLVEPDPSGTGVVPADPGPQPPRSRSPSPHAQSPPARPATRSSSEPPDGGLGWRSAEFPSPRDSPFFFQPLLAPPPNFNAELRGLHARMDRVETSIDARIDQAVSERLPGAVEDYLSRIGLSPELLKDLGEHAKAVIARRTQDNGSQTSEG